MVEAILKELRKLIKSYNPKLHDKEFTSHLTNLQKAGFNFDRNFYARFKGTTIENASGILSQISGTFVLIKTEFVDKLKLKEKAIPLNEFINFFERMAKLGVNYITNDGMRINLFFKRLIPLLENKKAELVLRILERLEEFLIQQANTDDKNYKFRAALKLLDECPINLTPLVQIKSEKKDDKEFKDSIVLDDLREKAIAPDAEFKNQRNCTPESIKAKEDEKDTLVEKLQKRLYANQIYVNSGGIVYQYDEDDQRLVGEESHLNDGNKIVWLMDGIDYQVLYRYFRAINLLLESADKFLATMDKELKENESLRTKPHYQKYTPLLKKLSSITISQHEKRLINLLDKDNLCQVLITEAEEDKGETLSKAFNQLTPVELTSVVPRSEDLFLLLLFHFKAPAAEFAKIWKSGNPWGLQNLIQVFEQAAYSTRNEAFENLLVDTNAAKDTVWRFMCDMPDYFELKFVWLFANRNLANYKQRILVDFCKTQEQQIQFFNGLGYNLCAELLNERKSPNEEKILTSTFAQLPARIINQFIPDQHDLYHIAVYYLQLSPAKMAELFDSGKPFPLERMVANNDYEFKHIPGLKKIIEVTPLETRIAMAWNLVCELPLHFSPKFMEKYSQHYFGIKPGTFQKFKPIILQLSTPYLTQNAAVLSNILNNGKLCQTIIEDKKEDELTMAVRKISPANLASYLPVSQLCFLILFHFEDLNLIRKTWEPTAEYPVQKVIERFITTGEIPVDCEPLIEKIKEKNNPEFIFEVMRHAPEHFEVNYVLEFLFQKFQEEEYKRKLHAIYSTPELQLRLFQALHPDDANNFLNDFEKYGLYIHKITLLNCCPKVRKTVVISRFALTQFDLVPDSFIEEKKQIEKKESEPTPASQQTKTEEAKAVLKDAPAGLNESKETKKEEVKNKESKDKISPVVLEDPEDKAPHKMSKKRLDQVIKILSDKDKGFSSRAVCTQSMDILDEYRKKNLRILGESYYGKDGTPSDRADAYVSMKKVLNPDNPNWQENFETLCRTGSFLNDAGWYNTEAFGARVMAPSKTLWRRVIRVRELIDNQIRFFEQFNNPELLSEIIRNDDSFNLLTSDELGLIFKYGNRALLLDLLQQNNRIKSCPPIPVSVTDQKKPKLIMITPDWMTSMVDRYDVAAANEVRNYFGVPLRIPAGFKPADLSKNGRQLEPELAYQYQMEDLQVAESILIREHRSVFCNQFTHEIKSQDDKPSNISFFYLPVTLRPLLGNNLNSRDFVQNIKNLVNTYQPKQNEEKKPVVFCGIVNLGGIHWVPYFIYKNKKNEIQIICVNPSAQKKGESIKQQQLEVIFRNIFPNCHVFDPDVTQQIRERDCGVDSAITLEDAFSTSKTAFPLFEIIDDRLVIHPERLTINFNNMRLYDYRQNVYHYSPNCERINAFVRTKLGEKLKQYRSQQYVTLNVGELKLDVDTTCTIVEDFGGLQLPYNYALNVRNQYEQDQQGVIYGEIGAHLAVLVMDNKLEGLDQIIKEFKTSFKIPDQKQIQGYVDKLIADPAFASTHARAQESKEDIVQIVTDVITKENIRDHYVEAIVNNYSEFLLRYSIDTPEDAQDRMIKAYLSQPEVESFYRALRGDEPKPGTQLGEEQKNDSEKVKLWRQLRRRSLDKVLRYHTFKIEEAHDEFKRALRELDGAYPSKKDLALAMANECKKLPNLAPSILFLEQNSRNFLDLIINTIADLEKLYTRESTYHLEKKLAEQKLENLTPFTQKMPLRLSTKLFYDLLPNERRSGTTILQQSDLFKPQDAKEAKEPQFNFFSTMIINEVDKQLPAVFDKALTQKLEPAIQQKIDSDGVRQLDIATLNQIIDDEKFANQFAEEKLQLFSELDLFKGYQPFYDKKRKELVARFRGRAQEVIRTRFNFLFSLLTQRFDEVEEKVLRSIFDNLEAQPADNITRTLLVSLHQPMIAEEQILRSMFFNLQPSDEIANTLIVNLFQAIQEKSLLYRLFLDSGELDDSNLELNTFVKLFAKDVKKVFINLSKNIKKLSNKIDGLCRLLQFLSKQFPDPFFKNMEGDLHKIQDKVKGCVKQPNTLREKLDMYFFKVQECTQQMMAKLMKGYKHGDIHPNGYTVQARVLLCHLLNIRFWNEQPPRYVSGEYALDIDKKVDLFAFQWDRELELDIPYETIFMPFPIEPQLTIPKTYGHVLTPRLLYELAANWLLHCDRKKLLAGERLPYALNVLFDALNAISSRVGIDQPLPDPWCQQHIWDNFLDIARIRSEAIHNVVTESFYSAIRNCANFVRIGEQKCADGSPAIKFSDLEEAFALYKDQAIKQSFARYRADLHVQVPSVTTTAGPGAPETKDDKWKKPFQCSFWGAKDEMQALEKCLKYIKTRHQLPLETKDFDLDYEDAQRLKGLLERRWYRLIKENKEEPANYRTFNTPEDSIYLLIALILKDVFRNYGETFCTYSLLMPGHINFPERVKKSSEKERKDVSKHHIDTINWRNVIVLPDHRWILQDDLITNYRYNMLNDTFSKTPLSKADVQHIIEQYPDVGKELLSIFVSRYDLLHNYAARLTFKENEWPLFELYKMDHSAGKSRERSWS